MTHLLNQQLLLLSLQTPRFQQIPTIPFRPRRKFIKRCRVNGCRFCKPGKPHYCKNCGDKDSTHFSSNCPKLKKRNNFGQPRKRCRVKGCSYCKPGKPHYCKNCGDKDSTHFSSNCPKLKKRNNFGKKDLKNSAIVLIKFKHILLLKDTRGYWVTPGGRRNKGETPWNAATREYQEETGYNGLPNWDKKEIKRHNLTDYDTNIFICRIKKKNVHVKFSLNNETNKAKWVSISDIVNDTHNTLNIRRSNKASLMDLYNMGEL